MNQDQKKLKVAEKVLDHIESGQVVGIGTGSTVNQLIEILDKVKSKIDGVVSSSEESTKRLEKKGVRILDIQETGRIPLYIDGADEANKFGQLIKGGGGALTREKILAQASDKFICIIDDSKLVKKLGTFPLPIEVISIAKSLVALEMIKLEGRPVLRENFITDNGHLILDVHHLNLSEPIDMEKRINDMPGVITNGLFAIRPANKLIIGTEKGIEEYNI